MHCCATAKQAGLTPGEARRGAEWAAKSGEAQTDPQSAGWCSSSRQLDFGIKPCLHHKKASASEPGAGSGGASAGGAAAAAMEVSVSAVCEASEKCSLARHAGGSACASAAAGSSSNSNWPACLAARDLRRS